MRALVRARRAVGHTLGAALCVFFLAATALAQDVLTVPPLSGRVVDQTGTLGAEQHSALTAKLAGIEQTLGSQVVVLLVPTTQPEDITSYTQRVGEQWKIGRRDVGDGLLIVVAKNDRKVRIEIAKALEGAVPDLMAKRIINEQITPAFKAGDFAGGLNAAVDAVAARIRGEGLPEPQADPSGHGFAFSLGLEEWLIFLFIAVPIASAVFTSLLGRKLGAVATGAGFGGLGWWATSSLWLAGLIGVGALVMVGLLGTGAVRRASGQHGSGPVIWTSGKHSGGWGGGDGGGFSSGGGGDFGGGGASGDW